MAKHKEKVKNKVETNVLQRENASPKAQTREMKSHVNIENRDKKTIIYP